MTVTMTLGRHVEHDERSRGYLAALDPEPRTVKHRHFGPVLSQGQVSSCTGNAVAQAMNCAPLHRTRSGISGPELVLRSDKLLTEKDAVRIYTRGTELDNVPGQMPGQDTGSTGIAVAKAAVEEGLIASYRHAFGVDQLVAALSLTAVIVGTVWDKSMFIPDKLSRLHPDGNEVGGHEYVLMAQNLEKKYFTLLNSWGNQWARGGYAYISFEDMAGLLARQGDVTVLVR